MKTTKVVCAALLLGGCGWLSPGGGGSTDGGPGDAGPQTGTITVSVVQAGAPINNAIIVTQSATGSVLNEGMTDVTGMATVTGALGGYATALWTDSAGNYLAYTFASVAPGDELLAKIVDPVVVSTPAGTPILVSIGTTSVTGATDYTAGDGCGDPVALTLDNSQHSVNTNPSCVDGSGTYSVLARAIENPGMPNKKSTVAYESSKGVAAGATLTYGTWTTSAPYTVTFTNAPATSASLSADSALEVNGLEFVDISRTYPSVTATTGASFDGVVPSAAGTADAFDLDVVDQFAAEGGRVMTTSLFQRTIPTPIVGPGPSMDLTATLLPRVSAPGLNSTDLKHLLVQFQTDAAITTADASSASLQWTDAASKSHQWVFFGPPTTSLAYPTLPTDGAGWGPAASDSIEISTVRVVDLSSANGYDGVRQIINRTTGLNILSGAGSLRISQSSVQ